MLVRLEKVNKYFNKNKRNEIHIINNTSFEIDDTGMLAILGKSGSGKTTLLNAIGGLDKINKGKIYINDKKITSKIAYKADKIRNEYIGYIFQDYKLLENKTVFDNVAMVLRMTGLKDKKEIEKRVFYVLEQVNMLRYKNRPARMLSGGEKQRVAIARAIVKNPKILIADEPTGNLDSKNTIEIMNILKAISKNRLVILVTHEVELARFYATRIIEIKDSKVDKDYINKGEDKLIYDIDNKIYLKDLNKQEIDLDNSNVQLNVFTDDKDISNKDINNKEINNKIEKLKLNLIIKNGNVYISLPDDISINKNTEANKVEQKSKINNIEIVDKNSGIEIIDEHFKHIDRNIFDNYEYNLDSVSDYSYKIKYKSIISFTKAIKNGFNRIANYSKTRKFLMLGYILSTMFIIYASCNIAGIKEVRDSDFMKTDRHYVKIEDIVLNPDNYEQVQKMKDVDYVIIGDPTVKTNISSNEFYQTSTKQINQDFSMAALDLLNNKQKDANNKDKKLLVYGRMPENQYEAVIDKSLCDNILNQPFSIIKTIGVMEESSFIGLSLQFNEMQNIKIVGVVDTKEPNLYINKSQFINIKANQFSDIGDVFRNNFEENQTKIYDYELFKDNIEIVKGREIENDYEVLINEKYQGEYKLNKTIDVKVNDKKLKVVGFYKSDDGKQLFLTNENTVRNKLFESNKTLTVYTNNKDEVIQEVNKTLGKNAIDIYKEDRETYLKDKEEKIKKTTFSAMIFLVISLIEIYLMMRSSFLSRIKEVGILRAIGVKKTDIYKMFLGEIISLTIITSTIATVFMTYILKNIVKIKLMDRMFMVNFQTISSALLIVFVFNIIIGLLPLVFVLIKKPAQILSRQDI